MAREDLAVQYVQMLRVQQEWYPSIRLVPADQDLYCEGVQLNRQIESQHIRVLYNELSDDGIVEPATNNVPDRIMLGTLHEAFDGYLEHIRTNGNKLEDGTLKSSQRKRLDYVESLKDRHADRPLHEITFDVIAEMFGYWTNRPKKTRGEGRYKRTSARHRLKELERFLGWLGSTANFDWEMPKGVDRISRRFTDLESDFEQSQVITKEIYTPVKLGLISQHADEFDRLLLFVCVNCAFGAAEVGRLTTDEILFNHSHEHSIRLNFDTTSGDSFILLKRHKSSMFGEWLLWPEAVETLRWGVERAIRLKSPFIVCRDDGGIMYDERAQNARQLFRKRWVKLIKRIQKQHPDFPYLPFGSLRDTITDTLRHRYSDELASICLAHKTAYKADSLFKCYGNRPFGKLHTAIRELREYFSPMFGY
ncbi:hypothetical protein [Rhodopirellula baltica]